MTVVVWVTEHTWQACVDVAKELAPPQPDVTLLAVVDTGTAEAVHGAYTGMFGRAAPDPAKRLTEAANAAAADVLAAAQRRLGRPARQVLRHGRTEREVVAAATGATLLVVARDAMTPGPKSLGKEVRFVVDHAPCPVLLAWPDPAGPPVPMPKPPPPDRPPPGPPPPGPRHHGRPERPKRPKHPNRRSGQDHPPHHELPPHEAGT